MLLERLSKSKGTSFSCRNLLWHVTTREIGWLKYNFDISYTWIGSSPYKVYLYMKAAEPRMAIKKEFPICITLAYVLSSCLFLGTRTEILLSKLFFICWDSGTLTLEARVNSSPFCLRSLYNKSDDSWLISESFYLQRLLLKLHKTIIIIFNLCFKVSINILLSIYIC